MTALCTGKSWLFDSTDAIDHALAARLCAACPVRDWCAAEAKRLRTSRPGAASGLVGTWAGRLYGANPRDWRNLEREDAMFTDEEAQLAHTAWNKGERNDRTRIGERVYQRRYKRSRRVVA